MIGLSFYDQDLFGEADRANEPAAPAPVGYVSEDLRLSDLSVADWDLIDQLVDEATAREFPGPFLTREEVA
jgi:hypothetical protein